MNFKEFTSGGVTYTAADQAAAWETYIQQDNYLSKHRGEYAERNGVFLPFVRRIDLSVNQELFAHTAGRRHGLEVRMDILNFGNLLNKNWGVGQRLTSNSPLLPQGADAQGQVLYELRVVSGHLLTKSLEQTLFQSDVWQIQFRVGYSF